MSSFVIGEPKAQPGLLHRRSTQSGRENQPSTSESVCLSGLSPKFWHAHPGQPLSRSVGRVLFERVHGSVGQISVSGNVRRTTCESKTSRASRSR